jgi:thermostable 8-oxoguanine DNA glycosylase
MIDPYNITNFNSTDVELEEVLMFWVCVAGKNAKIIASALDKLLKKIILKESDTPFEAVSRLNKDALGELLKSCGVGCHTIKARALKDLVRRGLDLRNCSIDELESVYGIGPKTARCFLIHSRPNVRHAGLDTHILKFLRSKGHKVPKSTPNTSKKYREIEELFLNYADKSGKNLAEFDLELWRKGATDGRIN